MAKESFDKAQGSKLYFDPVDPKVNFPRLEEEILKFWKENKIFEKSIETKPKNKKWTFLDGPPFITGMPHYGTLLSSIPKDAFARYWTMKGYRVRRVWGWDCHGLPAENKVEIKLGITRKKDIEEKIGVKKFIDECKTYVSKVSSEWEWYVDHIGRWVDFKNSYKTMDLSYMESVMWVFKQIYDKGFIYKGLRVSLYCPHCSTPISNFEVAMDNSYKEITEPSDIYKYQLADEKDTFLLAWSTTPWNKLATPALAVNPKLKYVKVEQGKEKYILAKSTIKNLNKEPYKIVEEFYGKALIGKQFIPHYNFYKIDSDKKAFIVIGGDFVTAEEGTGIVTIAAYGEEDLEIMLKENIQIILHVDEEGIVTKDSPVGGGMYYLQVDKLVNEDLEKRGLLYKEEPYTHTVPTCWRCATRLIYAPQEAWYIDIKKLKPKLILNNKAINWFPKHFKYGRFLKSVEAAPDWCISRSRYWGSPVPVWECECGERYVPGSIKELELLSGRKIKDLHKPGIDEVFVNCKKCGNKARRVDEVLDSWTEAGSASFAERHYPFNTKEDLKDFFPPDFITEYTGQIRAWFYVLHVISTALFDSYAFKNVLVSGVILGTDGRKMSKNYGNYPDPKEMIQKYGGDALRLYLMGSPVMNGEDICISEEEYRNQIKNFLLTLWNIYNFFVSYANLDGWKPDKNSKLDGKQNQTIEIQNSNLTILDQWVLLRLNQLEVDVTRYLENYNVVDAIFKIKKFVVDDFSLWYIRRSRERVGPAATNLKDKEIFYQTSYQILVSLSKLLAPISPFVSDYIYKNLTKKESVHLADWPKSVDYQDEELIAQMEEIRNIVEKVHSKRKEVKIPVRQPLLSVKVYSPNEIKINPQVLEIAKEELNIKDIIFNKGRENIELDIKITPELKEEADARKLIRNIQEERRNMGLNLTQKINVYNDWLPQDKKLVQFIKSKTATENLKKGDFKIEKI